MKRSHQILLAIVVAALALRIALALAFIRVPGLHDPIHYYNLARHLVQGQGFTVDYVWHYSTLHDSIVHPDDHWMPLTGVIAAGGMLLGGVNVGAALLPFLLLGALLPVLVYALARQWKLSEGSALIAAAFALALPEFVTNSLHTDTTLPNMLLVGGTIYALNHGMQRGTARSFVIAGVLAGLAYLNRNDALLLLPMLVVLALAYRFFGREQRAPGTLRNLWLVPLAMLIVVSPWLLRNLAELGQLGSAETSKMFFFADQRDHYAYGAEFTLSTLLERQTLVQIIGKRLFELAAAFKQMVVSLDLFLPIAVAGGGLLLLVRWRSERERLLLIAPALILLLGTLVAYPLLIPYKSQSGSFHKAYVTLIPLLLPLAAYGLEQAVHAARMRRVIVVLVIFFAAANSFDQVRLNAAFNARYYSFIEALVRQVNDLPDVNGDGEVRLMTQDPYILSYHGVRSAMTPFSTRDALLEIAQRYGVDYLMLPAARPSVDDLYGGAEQDVRFVFATRIPEHEGLPAELYALYPAGAP